MKKIALIILVIIPLFFVKTNAQSSNKCHCNFIKNYKGTDFVFIENTTSATYNFKLSYNGLNWDSNTLKSGECAGYYISRSGRTIQGYHYVKLGYKTYDVCQGKHYQIIWSNYNSRFELSQYE